MVSAWGTNQSQWEFIYSNRIFGEIFKMKESKIAGQNIKIIQPKVFAEHHDSVLRKFFHDGQQSVLWKLRILFGKDSDGFLIPISFRVNFFYHQKFQYTFIAQFEKCKYFNLYQEETQKLQSDETMFFITDDDFYITDYSRSFLNYLGVTHPQLKQIEEQQGRKMTLNMFIVDLDKIMSHEFGNGMAMKKDNTGMANKIVFFRRFN